jgi:membrane protease YdiL (CAAX protease family)
MGRSIIAVICLAASFVFLQAAHRVASRVLPGDALDRRITLIPALLDRGLYGLVFCGGGLLLIGRLRRSDRPGPALWLRGESGRIVPLAAAIGGGLALYVAAELIARVALPSESALNQSLRASLGDASGLALQLFCSALLTPIFEEVFYRGLLQNALADWTAAPVALGLAAALFAAAHPLAVLPVLALAGLCFGILFWRFGLASSILAHATYNALILLSAGAYLPSFFEPGVRQ